MTKREFKPPLDPETRDALGMVVACWVDLGTAIEYVIWGLLNIEFKRARVVTTELGILAQLDMLVLLAKEHFSDPDKVAEALALVKRAEKLRIERNRLVHARWQGRSRYHKHSAKRRWKVELFSVTPAEIILTARLISELAEDFYMFAFKNDLADDIPPWAPSPTA